MSERTETEQIAHAAQQAAKEPLRQSEERFRLMVESVRDYAIFMLDPAGHIMSWNPGAERIKGYTAREIVGKHLSVFYEEDARARHHPEDELRQALEAGSYAEEGWRIRKDGRRFWASVVITALHDETGEHVGFAKVTRDLTERRAAEQLLRESEERMRLLVESVQDYAIYMLDPDGRISTWNSGAEKIKGYKVDEVRGRHFSLFYPPEDVAMHRPERELAIATAEGRYEEEGWRVRKNGERFRANVVLTAVYDDNHVLRGFAKVTRDLTERRRIEEIAIAERERAAAAHAAVQVRDEFISVAAHELRTPLTALQLKLQGVDQVLHKSATVPVEKISDRLRASVRQVSRLSELVERLLDVSRILAGKLVLELEETDLTALVQQVIDDFAEPARQAGCALQLQGAPGITGTWDRARLEQVMVNLLSNALKYGQGKPIDVRVEARDGGGRVVVEDHGIGIAADDLGRIFGRFERAAPARHYGGLGVGLYVTRNIVEAHGGTITVASEEGSGATFVVDLPRTPP